MRAIMGNVLDTVFMFFYLLASLTIARRPAVTTLGLILVLPVLHFGLLRCPFRTNLLRVDAVNADDEAHPARRGLIARVVQTLLDRDTAERIRLHAEWERRIGQPSNLSQPINSAPLSTRDNLQNQNKASIC